MSWLQRQRYGLVILLELSIDFVPMPLNVALRSHWSKYSKESKEIFRQFSLQLRGKIPKTPIKKASVEIWRYSAGRLDKDNSFFTCKHVLDNLVKLKVLENDTVENVPDPQVYQVKIKRGEPRRLLVRFSEIDEPKLKVNVEMDGDTLKATLK